MITPTQVKAALAAYVAEYKLPHGIPSSAITAAILATGLAQENQRLKMALNSLAVTAEKILSDLDEYNEKNSAYIIGPVIFQLNSTITTAKNLLNDNRAD